MKKSMLALALSPLLVACGGGDKAPAPSGGTISSANAVVTRTGPCPILNGTYLRAETDLDEEAVLHIRSAVFGSNYSYSFLDPALSAPRYELADNVTHVVAGDPGHSSYRLTCDATSITSISRKPGADTITIRYVKVDDAHVRVETLGAEYMDGLYEKQ